MTYAESYQQSIQNKEAYWQQQAQAINWYKEPTSILSKNELNNYQWFSDGELNTSYLALDYHIEQGRGEQTAIIYDSPVTNTKQKISYLELKQQVAKFASVLTKLNVVKGDRVLIYMPMIPQAVVAMLACARIGAVHSVVFGGFASHELAVRIDDATPNVILTASCGIEVKKVIPYKALVDHAIELATHKPKHTVIYQRPEFISDLSEHDHDWNKLMADAQEMDPVVVKGTDPLYILYTSGTTGTPKGVVRDNGGHAVAMKYSMKTVYGVDVGDVFWAASDVGWVVGHSYIVYGPLISGCTTVLYEGKPVGTPDAGAFWRVCEEYNVNVIFSAPTAFRAICKEDPNGNLLKQYQLSHLKRLYLAGERLDPATYNWLSDKTQLPVIDHWWQTETGWAIAGIPVGIEMKDTLAGSAGYAIPGFDVKVLNNKGEELTHSEQGSITIKLPLPPGCLTTIWQNNERFKAGYLNTFDGYYLTGDGGYINEQGHLFIMGRTDDVINVAGHRLSTGEMEEVLSSNDAVAECAVVGINDTLKGQVPFGLVVLKNDVTLDHNELKQALKSLIRSEIGAIASLKDIIIVERLPKTRSGKILRKTMRQMIDNEPYQIPSTIDDSSILDELLNHFKELNYN